MGGTWEDRGNAGRGRILTTIVRIRSKTTCPRSASRGIQSNDSNQHYRALKPVISVSGMRASGVDTAPEDPKGRAYGFVAEAIGFRKGCRRAERLLRSLL